MKVGYRVIGELKKVVEPDRGQLELPAGSTVGDLMTRLAVPEGKLVIAVVEGRRKHKRDLLEDGKEVVLIPPAIGG
ncbi:MAG: MoaD/ThiS family protein [Syntrophomonadaceae bacterium]|nr:MoaD/ThiS family protein [Syntrophomonadaceae bacterium]